MLVLSRKVNESIIIGDNIRLTLVSIRGHQVRIGIEAPPEVSIFREEIILEQRPIAAPDQASWETPPALTDSKSHAGLAGHR